MGETVANAGPDPVLLAEALLADTVHGVMTLSPVRGSEGGIEDFRITMANAAAERLLVFEAATAVGQRLRDAFPLIAKTHHVETYKRIVKHRSPSSFKMQLPRSLGGGWLTIYASPMGDGVLVTLSDAAATPPVRDEGWERDGLFRLFLDVAPAPIVMLDTELCVLHATHRWFAEFHLVAEQDIVGRSIYETIPRVPQRWRDAHARGLAGEVVSREEDAVRGEDGETIWYRWAVHPWHRSDGAIGGIIIFAEDISARRNAELALEKVTERLELALEAGHEGLWDWDLKEDRIRCNRRFAALYGLPEGTREFDASIFRKVLTAADYSTLKEQMLWHLEHGGDMFEFEYPLRGRSGPGIRLECRATVAERNRRGKPRRVVGMTRDCTERLEMQEAIERKNATLEGLAHSLPGSILIVDRAGGVDEVVSLQASLHPDPGSRLLVQHLEDLWPRRAVDDLLSWLNEWKPEVASAHRIRYEIGRQVRWMECRAGSLASEGRNHLVLHALDVTDVVEAEDMRNRLVDASPDLLTFVTADGWFTRTNGACKTILGYTPEEMCSKPFIDFVHPQDRAATLEEFAAIPERGLYSGYENRYRHKDGTWRWLQWTVTPMEHGECFVIGRDVTARHEAQALLTESDERYRDLFNNALTGRCILVGMKPIHANTTIARLLGLDTAEELEAFGDLSPFMAPETRTAFSEMWKDFLADGSNTSRGRHRFFVRGGGVVWLDVSTRRVLWQGAPAAESTFIDVTAEVAYEEELEAAREVALAAVKAKSDFLATVSHEIRTPLNAIIGMTRLLLRTDLTDDQKTYADQNARAGEHLLRIVNDVLDFTRLEAHRAELSEGDLDLAAEITSVCDSLRASREDSEVSLDLRLTPGAQVWVRADGARLRQLLFNIVGNALKFTDEGSVTVAVDVRPCEDGCDCDRILSIDVTDTGIGIPAEKIPDLFERFTQLDSSASRRHGGTGLGLAISKRICTLMGGRISVESTVGEGSCFSISVPVSEAERATAEESANVEDAASEGPADENSRFDILVAEDNPANTMIVKLILEQLGHAPTLTSNGGEAVEAAEARGFDLILMDIQMPVMDGHEAARVIRTGGGPNRDTPIVALTAHALDDERRKFLDDGFADVVAKPIMVPVLAEAILRHARRHAEQSKAVRGAA